MTEVKVKIEKKPQKSLPKETGEVFVPQPSMTDVKKERKTLVPASPKVIRLKEEKTKPKRANLFLALLIIVVSLLVLGLAVWFGFL